MRVEWADSGVDLHLDVDRTAGRHRGFRDRLEHELRAAILDGRLVAGTLVPPSRTLALDLGVARNTVAAAYAQLTAEGWLVGRSGSGTRVAERPGATVDRPGVVAGEVNTLPFDLRAGFPDLTSFPRAAWLAAARAALTTAPAVDLGYGQPAGLPVLRTSLAAYLGRARGALATPDRTIVTPGFTSALVTLATVLRDGGARRIGVEEYGHERHRFALRSRGLETVPLAVDDEGAVPEGLDRLDAVLLTAAHQFPVGPALSARRRTAFVAWAARTGGLIVEDDYDGEFRYDRRALGAMQALAPDHVVYAGTVSKTLSPGLRLGWLVVPARLVEPLVAVQARDQSVAGAVEQLTLARFVDDGRYDRHVRSMRNRYRHRRDRLLDGLAHLPGRDDSDRAASGTSAGLHLTVVLPPSTTESDAVAAAARHGVAVSGLAEYGFGPSPGYGSVPGLVIGYATPPPHRFAEAVHRLVTALGERGPTTGSSSVHT